jgi:hypothetical protein
VENSEREFWGRERLENLLRACRDYKPAQIIERILLEISSFSRNAPQRDDMTLVVIVGFTESRAVAFPNHVQSTPRCGIVSEPPPFCKGVAMKKAYTDKQGQYLAFIYYYNKIHGCAPSEAEL